MMVVVPALACCEQCYEAKIRSGIVEVPMAKGMIGAIDDRVQEDVNASLHHESDAAPERAQQEHENRDADQHADKPKPEEMAIKPVIADVRCKGAECDGIFRFTIVVVHIAQQNAPQPFQNRTMGIAFHVCVAMVLAMDGHPFFGVDSGPEPKLHAHRKSRHGMQIHAAMSQGSMQVDAGRKGRQLNNYNHSNHRVKQM